MIREQENKPFSEDKDGLTGLGWNPALDEALKLHSQQDATLHPARITGVRKNHFMVDDGGAERLTTLTGRFHHRAVSPADLPVAGDWALLDNDRITALLPRRNILSRGAAGERHRRAEAAGGVQPIAANLDTVFVICGMDRDYNLRRIERYITLVYNCGMNPVVLLNKCDLHQCFHDKVEAVEEIAIGVPVHAVSAAGSVGLEVLDPYLEQGKTVALLGSSGVGKTTLVNRLAGRDRYATSAVSDSVGKGVHTTTTRDLIRLPGGGMIIDNPGIREIAFWDDEDGIDRAFADIEELAQACRFADCRHESEPGCGVRAAVESGDLPVKRLESYLKMKRELVYLSERRSKSADRLEKERWQWVSLKIKEINKVRR